MFRKVLSLALLLGLVWPAVVGAQGLLIDVRPDHEFRLPRPHPWPYPPPRVRPEPPPSYKIRELAMNVNLVDQVAKTQVTQTFVNTGSRPLEVCFVFPLPYDGAVDQMTFMVDGREYEAKLLSAEEARRIYEGYVRRNQDPALVEWIGTGMIQTSIFPVPPGAERSVVLKYSQLCRKAGGLTELLIPLSTAKYTSHPVEAVSIEVTIQSQSPLRNVYSPTHAVRVDRPGDTVAKVVYQSKNEVPMSDFRLLYDVGTDRVGANVISYRPLTNEDGYFLLLVSPEIKSEATETVKKTVVFVVDRSGSMSGQKIEQAKGALRFVLNNLREGDLFNIIAYDSTVESFRPELQAFSSETRAQALGFVEGLYAGGSTNIDGALKAVLGQLQDGSRPNYVIFLTDGLPTTGERNEAKIVAGAKGENKVRARLFCFGVGYDVNSRLLDKLAREGFGQSQYVRPDEDIESHVSALYNRIGAPVMTQLAIQFDVEGVTAEQGGVTNRVYPKDAYDLFAGDQLVLVGRYKHAGEAKITIQGQIGTTRHTFHFPGKLADVTRDESYAFVEKLWALRRVGEIIDEIDLHGKNDELVNELVALATRHGILTPYTSFLADENVAPSALAENRRFADKALDALGMEAGRGGFAQRLNKAELQQAATAPSGGFGGGVVAAEDERKVSVQSVQNVGNKTFYFRNNRWVDSAVTPDQEKTAQKVERYSAEYFDIVRKFGREAAKYLALEGEVVLVLDGQAYTF